MLMIVVNDTIFYITVISHILLAYYGLVTIDNGLLLSNPTWYCPLNYTLIATCIITSIELAALLSIIRYVKICLFKRVTLVKFYILIALSVISSFVLSSLHGYYNSYSWSELDFYCIPSINIEKSNKFYFVFFFSISLLRTSLCLPIISFCYLNITLAYFKIIDPSITGDIIATNSNLNPSLSNHQFDNRNSNNKQDFMVDWGPINSMTQQQKQEIILPLNSSETQLLPDNQLRLRKITLISKISVIILSYISCLLPDLTIDIAIIDNELLLSNPTWYCALNLSLTVTSASTFIELAVLLSIVSYIKICLCERVVLMRYYLLISLFVILSLTLSSLNAYYNSYTWHELDLYCVLNFGIEKKNKLYLIFYYTIVAFGIILCPPVICFCYLNITFIYFKIMDPSIVLNAAAVNPNFSSINYQFIGNNDNNSRLCNLINIRGTNRPIIVQRNQGTTFQLNSNESQLLTVT
ncbi:hypothetical protein K502DRAFT_345535 [Neoconidiobolus thromboides FSU 785]|nr:hypothetical protein K502DRAFT_345535 [Neoconidiobolus thromboides FSU 785]